MGRRADPDDDTRRTTPGAGMLSLQELSPGALLAGRYRILEHVGSGGSGDVYRAHDQMANLDVAVKIFFPGPRRRDRERVRRELELVRTLRHPAILNVFDMGEADGLVYTVSELLHGESLRDRLVRLGPLDTETTKSILIALLEALACAHGAGVVHRDIKPSNVFLVDGSDGSIERVVLIDFGLARHRDDDGLTTVGRFLGTPAYSSPEQIRGEASVGPRSDLYSVGATLWEMISGSPPFEAGSDADVMAAHLGEDVARRLRSLRHAPAWLRLLTLRLLARDPEDRPASAQEALAWIRRHAEDRSLATRLALARRRFLTSTSPVSSLARLRLAATLVAGACILALGIGCAGLPAKVALEEGRLVMRSLAGLTVREIDFPRPVRAVARDPSWRGWLGHAFAALAPPAGADKPVHAVYEIGWLAASPEPVPTTAALYRRDVYPDVTTPFVPSALHVVDRRGRPDVPLLVLVSRQDPLYPVAIDLVMTRSLSTTSPVVSYYHPGHTRAIEIVDEPGADSPQLVFLATNNPLGHRLALGSIPLGRSGQGQAPPFASALRHVPPASGWYRFLPHVGYEGKASLRIVRDHALVEPAGGRPVSFDLASGVPDDAQHRGGLPADAWRRTADRFQQALVAAARAEQSGNLDQAAAVLEEVGAAPDLPAEMSAIALYHAAQVRRSMVGRDENGPQAGKALENIARALQAESVSPPRYRLLQAELFARGGRTADLDAAFSAWGGRYDESMHAYDWMLVDWMAGSSRPLDLFFAGWPDRERRTSNWALLLELVHGYRDGEPSASLARLAAWPSPATAWAEHSYWAARSLLESPDPAPARALEEIQRGTSRPALDPDLPLAALRLRALSLAGVDLPSPASLDDAVASLQMLAARADSSPRAAVYLPLAARDVAEVAARIGDEDLAARIEREHLDSSIAQRILD